MSSSALLTLNPETPALETPAQPQKRVIGIDMGGTSVKMGVCEGVTILEDFVLEIVTEPYREAPAEELIAEIVKKVEQLREKFPGVVAVGMGVPGFTDFNSGFVHHLTNVPTWHDIHLNDVLTKAIGLPCFAENDANCMTYAEFRFGAGNTNQAVNMIGVTLGTGVGGGLIINGQMFRGSTSGAGEIGQMSLDYQGRSGEYGNLGALEKYIGNREVAERAEELYAAEGRTLAKYSPQALGEASEDRDPLALKIWDEYTTQLASTLANCIYFLNPDTIVIGGGVARAGDKLFVPLMRKLKEQLAPAFVDQLVVLPAHFRYGAGIIGSAALALTRI